MPRDVTAVPVVVARDDDQIDVIWPDPDDGMMPCTTTLSRAEFYARLEGCPLLKHLRRDPLIRVVSLLDGRALAQWIGAPARRAELSRRISDAIEDELGSSGKDQA